VRGVNVRVLSDFSANRKKLPNYLTPTYTINRDAIHSFIHT